METLQYLLRLHHRLVHALEAFGVLCVVWVLLLDKLLLFLIHQQLGSYIFFDRIKVEVLEAISMLRRRLVHDLLELLGIV